MSQLGCFSMYLRRRLSARKEKIVNMRHFMRHIFGQIHNLPDVPAVPLPVANKNDAGTTMNNTESETRS